MKEEFKTIEELPRYMISNIGNVFSKINNRLLKTSIRKKDGYVQGHFMLNGKCISRYIHRLQMETFHPLDDYTDMQVNHINGIKSDNRLDNLEWVTQQENIDHSIMTGLKPNISGEMSVVSKLTWDEVDLIRVLYATNEISQPQLGRLFGVTHANIGSITRNETWEVGPNTDSYFIV